ncbi:methyltransferase domain-containing protein [Saccharopolyspora hattusasensis]|uniref:methyltransferase domain-containing protein n=1 Tax=Saccharopolyspora hattusasensis TaxID=1128679 RepID=UPI003D97A619
MTTQIDSGWEPRARWLADELTMRGDVSDRAWIAAVAAVPRHVFVPEVYEQDQTGRWQTVDVTSAAGLDRVYSPVTLFTALADRGTHYEGISSSTKPDLMLRMLEALDVHDGHRVLEIGTGTGYNAALLSHRLGDDRVYSVDVDAELVEPARERLASVGYRPTLVTRDGAEGIAEHAPYDRIIATCSVPVVPQAWLSQLAPGGLALVDLKRGTGAGNLVLLRRERDGLEGRFTERWAAFMAMRHYGEPARAIESPNLRDQQTRTTTTPPNPWSENRVVWFLAHFTGLPVGVRFGMRFDPDTRQPTAGTITAPDGSHAFVMMEPTSDGEWSVTESGPTSLWESVERAHDLWEQHGHPDWSRLGVTVNPDGQQWVWIDTPHSPASWELHA